MRRLLDALRRSFSARLSIWVVLFAALIYLGAQMYVAFESRRTLKKEVINGASQVLDNTILRLNNILEDVELAADNLEWLVYRHLTSPDTLMEYSRSTVQGNMFLNGVSISFEPYFFKDRQYFSAYSSNTDGVIETIQEGSDDYQYFYMDWYLQPKLLNQPCWTEPYSDWESDDDPTLQTEMLISYCKPLTRADGTFIGSISLDLNLQWLSETISAVKPYSNSYSILVSRGGTFIVHPDPEKLFYETIFTRTLVEPDPALTALGNAMTGWEEGMAETKVNGEHCFVFYKPVKATGWSMAIVCPKRDIFKGFNRLRAVALSILLLGLLMMFLTCFLVIRKSLKPLNDLARQAEDIASGHFDSVLPQVERTDEIGVLSRSFAHMQTSLVKYIDELTATTAKKERIEGELQIARNIQMGMVPRVFPPFPDRSDIDLYASIRPAKEVGGDLYDYFIQKGKLYFCIGDVSGKGVPASLIMAVAKNLFRVGASQALSVSRIARMLNERMSEDNEQMMFITMFIGAVDLKTGSLSFCNCGHNPPVILSRDGKAPEFLDFKVHVPLGVSSDTQYEDQKIPDFRNMPLFLYTDGLNEAENAEHEQFGNDRMMQILGSEPFTSAQVTVERVGSAVAAHIGDAEPSDDLTLLCLEIATLSSDSK